MKHFKIYRNAPEGASPKEMAAYLDETCADDTQLRAKVENLLAMEEDTIGFKRDSAPAKKTGDDSPPPADTTQALDPDHGSEREGDLVGPYKLLQKIGEGGFGTVWMAEQLEPISRKVALKVIKAGMDTREVLARFEAERQALAMMDDPNIARVIDAGATEAGRPFFAMELVKGIPITAFCDRQKLDTRQRLELMRDVCSAVNHAHQKGIIHRDLKPSNVMVTLHGDKPVVKVIDFGIAKATQSKLTDKTLFTRFEQFVGTPVYMSPEQAAMSGLDIDTRSDIYSLGVLLYELLAGQPPFDPRTLASGGYDEMRRIIQEKEPLRPSRRMNTVAGEDVTRLTTAHGAEPHKIERLLKGELDWIVMKAIDKDRTRRYETANALSADIGRYLADEPVLAVAPSAAYRFRKMAQRNRTVIGVAALIAVVMVVATAVSLWQAVKSEKAREEAETISTFLTEIFQSPDPARDGRTITVAETLDRATRNLETDLGGQPDQQARLRSTLGDTYNALGLYLEAIPLQEQVRDFRLAELGPEHPDTLDAMAGLALSYSVAGRNAEAWDLRREVLSTCEENFGPEDARTLDAQSALAQSYRIDGQLHKALEINEAVLETLREVFGPRHPQTLAAMHAAIQSYFSIGNLDEAAALCRETVAVHRKRSGPEHPNTLRAMYDLAKAYHELGQRAEALKLREELLAIRRRVLGPEHPETLATMNTLAGSYRSAGRFEEATELAEELLKLRRQVSGPEHPGTIEAMDGLAHCYRALERFKDAMTLREDVLEIRHRILGPEQPGTIGSMTSLAESYRTAGRLAEALALSEEALALRKKVSGPENPDTITAIEAVAHLYAATGRDADALTMREEVLEMRHRILGADHPETLDAMHFLAYSLFVHDRKGEALTIREQVLEKRTQLLGAEHPATMAAMTSLAVSYQSDGRPDAALELFEKALAMRRKVGGDEHSATLNLMLAVANAYWDRDMPDAIDLYRDVIDTLGTSGRSSTNPGNTVLAMGRLAVHRSASGRHREGATLIESAFDLVEDKLGRSPAADLLLVDRLSKLALQFTTLHTWHDDFEGHATTAKRLLAVVEAIDNPKILERASRAASLHTHPDPTVTQAALDLARRTVELSPTNAWSQLTLGMAEYRRGQFAEAEAILGELENRIPPIRDTAAFFRAMALWQLDRKEEARTLHARTEAALPPLPDAEAALIDGSESGDLIARIARREAGKLLAEDR